MFTGNTLIHQLTASTPMELRIDMTLDNNTRVYAKYSHFAIGPETTQFELNVSGYSGNAGIYIFVIVITIILH